MPLVANSEPCGLLPEWSWVDGFLAAKFPGDSLTLRNYLSVWRVWQKFLLQHGISTPTDIARETGAAFLKWRLKTCSRVTAVSNLHVFHSIMEEATLRELCVKNPLRNLGIGRGPVPEKPEVTPELEQEIAAAIERDSTMYREFLRVSMVIGIYQGRRIAETRFQLSNVDFANNRIRFWVKGQKWHVQPLHGKVRAVLLPLKEVGKEWSFDAPADTERFSYIWHVFLVRHGFIKHHPRLCFHSFRVSCISRLARAGVPMTQSMRFVGQTSLNINKIYTRVTCEDLSACINALK